MGFPTLHCLYVGALWGCLIMADRDRLKLILSDIVESTGCECVLVDIVRIRSGWSVKLYIDAPEGVGHPECERVSRAVSEYLDACEENGEPWFEEKYLLEVSSPGIERPLCKKEHYMRFLGSPALIRTKARKKFSGRLLACDSDGNISLSLEDGSILAINVADVSSANLVYEPEKSEKKNNKKTK